jgi:hypothetical protein
LNQSREVDVDEIRVAILCGDEVVASSDDMSAVHVAAAMIASKLEERRTAMQPIAEGRREACRRIAVAEV